MFIEFYRRKTNFPP